MTHLEHRGGLDKGDEDVRGEADVPVVAGVHGLVVGLDKVVRLCEAAVDTLVVEEPHHRGPKHSGVDEDVVLPVLKARLFLNICDTCFKVVVFYFSYLEGYLLKDADTVSSQPDRGLAPVPHGDPAVAGEPSHDGRVLDVHLLKHSLSQGTQVMELVGQSKGESVE